MLLQLQHFDHVNTTLSSFSLLRSAMPNRGLWDLQCSEPSFFPGWQWHWEIRLTCAKRLWINLKDSWGFDSPLEHVTTTVEEKVAWWEAIAQGWIVSVGTKGAQRTVLLEKLSLWHHSFFISGPILSTNHYSLFQGQISTANKHASSSVISRTVTHILLFVIKMLFSALIS